ncbi:hypothetical protein ACOTHJ_13705 [Achromobacter xylosoxidans]|uniref:hypothetical protein n=1 Tax=Achromobacter anxifer TaxID=1287737 RepID=UPI00155B9893|nr:hypothetical protein [Achromobacter anxifer]CAB5514742.1 hypothetical protein LMG26857_03801 [Achromobacter anxifer]
MSKKAKGWRIEVREYDTDKVVQSIPCKDEHGANRADAGMQHNLNHDKFYTKVCPPETANA